ncbi:MAG: Ig-like domain-containing protein, partial [Bacteroidota bacterium]
MKTITSKRALFKGAFIILLFLLTGNNLYSQANSIRTGATFNWADTQSNPNQSATLENIEINGSIYNTFAVPSGYSLIQVGPAGHSINRIRLNGAFALTNSSDPNWNTEALNAYQSLNLNHFFANNGNGQNICEDYAALATTSSQIKSVTYSPAIPVNNGAVLAVTERNANNCQHIAIYGIPPGGGSEQMLGQTFVRNWSSAQVGPQADVPPETGADYWLTERVNENNGTIGIALYNLTDMAPEGSQLTEIRFTAATVDVADGKFFVMQTYAQDDTFNPDFEEVFNGDVGANDNVPVGSSYTYFSSSSPFNGTVVVNTDGTFTYTPDPGFTGTDTFEIQVCLPAPNQTVCDISTVTLNVKSGVSINNASADEGDNLTFTISINDPINQAIDFNLTYANNSTTDSDYSGPSSVTLPANESSVSFDVLAVDDVLIEPTETFTITMVNPSDIVTILDGDGNGTINDDDAAGSGVQFDATNITVTEGTDLFARFSVSFNGTIAP